MTKCALLLIPVSAARGGVSEHDGRWGKWNLGLWSPSSSHSLNKSRLARLFGLDRPPLGGMPFRSFTHLMGQTESAPTLPSSLVPPRLLSTTWIETGRGITGKDESLLRLCPLPSSHLDYCRPLGSRLEEGSQARMRVCSDSALFPRPTSTTSAPTLPSSLVPPRLLSTTWIETGRGITGKDESLLRLCPLPSSHLDYCRPLGSRLEEGSQARMRGTSAPTLPSSLVPPRLLSTTWIETGREITGKDESLLRLCPLPSSHFNYCRPLGSRLEEG
ncbi:hypothetical protein PRIPAC_92662 [Pristionchus pacificus]|uniref:Uncharacterized protein n=1 Tax=Pristionchus pacificus TaxID=54126 RepID=A0A2A6BBQ7_PRIPA|nr:hypothetical protein PRIPAC_92662 [Pristionchus pacificus]|eukprot:PDM63307.1 hypothetical protein PRIPAC_50522 [Pristionchus pacificus]